MSTAEFLQEFSALIQRHGWRTTQSPWAVVEEWEQLVEDFEEGYHWDYDEYMNDTFCRKLLECAFTDARMQVFTPQVDAMKERVHRADARAQRLFLPDIEIGPASWPWWLRGVLANGVGDYEESMKDRFAVDLASGSRLDASE